MSRSQQQQVINTAEGNSAADQTNATNAITAENTDIGNYQQQLAKYASSNPYTSGGEYQTSQNQTLAANADAGSGAITNAVQTQAQRTGQNAGAAVATAAEAGRANQRTMSANEGEANDARIGDEAGYNRNVVAASEVPAQLQAGIYNASIGGANSALNTAGQSAQTPGFWDELGKNFQQGLGAGAAAAAGCWIAAELYGGWNDPRTVDVRRWLFYGEFQKHWYGRILAKMYLACGEPVASMIRRHPSLRKVFRPMFDAALKQARKAV